MSVFWKFFYELIMLILTNIARFFITIFGAFAKIVPDFKSYFNVFNSYRTEFNALGWITSILSILILIALFGLIFYQLFKLITKYIVFRRKIIDESSLLDEVKRLNKEVKQLVDEKNSIMAMKVSQIGLRPGEELDENGEPVETEAVDPNAGNSRFVKLIAVDKKYSENPFTVTDPQNYTLSELVDAFRRFACSNRLYYDRSLVMAFVAGLGASKLIILEGISGTGKTSLPYSWGKFLKHDSAICAVQPSWRDRSELIGYLNEFTKRFNESDFLKNIYDFTYRDDIGFVVLDEMNLARVEYYFAEILSVLEMHDPNEWMVDVVPDVWPNDPVNLIEGKCKVSSNIWFVGTANNDDSTFTITDKVYDRCIPIGLNTKGTPFECEPHPAMQVSNEYLTKLFNEAKAQYAISEEVLQKLDMLDYYVIENFRLAFGNRIMRQIKDFVPVFVACGGTEIDGLDYMMTNKIFRKFEGLNIAFMGDNIKKLINQLEKTFGKGKMPLAKEYLERIMKMG